MKAYRTQTRHRGWFIPAVYVAITLVVGVALPRLEHRFFPESVSGLSVGSAMAIASSIASGMIALTGIVFSMAFVMVQFSATAYSPRLVLWVARDKVVAHSLGAFTSTFLYSLLLLVWVDRDSSGRVPLVSGWLVLITLLASMGVFVALIERIALLQVNRMLIFTGNRGRQAIAELYPLMEGKEEAAWDSSYEALPVSQTIHYRGHPQAIQALDTQRLVDLAAQAGAVIELTAAVGDTTLERMPLLYVRGAKSQLDEDALRPALELGDERTFEQDPKYALRLVVDIAIKALSPAVNDPTTAVQALDQIEDLLIRLGNRQLDVGQFKDAQGVLRVVVPFPSWEDFLRLSLDEIRYCGGSSVQVMRRMRALLENLKRVVPPTRHPALIRWETRVKDTVERSFSDAVEKREASVADRQGLGITEEEQGPPSGP